MTNVRGVGLYLARGPANPHAGLLIRTWACCSEPGSPDPHAGLLFRAWVP